MPLCVYHLDKILEFTDKIYTKYNKSSKELKLEDLTKEE